MSFFGPLNYVRGKGVTAETSACEGNFLELLAQGPNVFFSPEFEGYFEEGFELDGDAREGLKV